MLRGIRQVMLTPGFVHEPLILSVLLALQRISILYPEGMFLSR